MTTDTTQRIEAAPSASRDLGTIVVVSAAHLVSHLHIMTLPVLLPLLKDELQIGFFELGLALTAFNVVSGLTQAPMGFLVDRIGARTVLMAGLLLGGLAFASLGLYSSYAWLIVVALVAGLANCVYHPADYAILSEGIAEDRMARAFSFHTFAGFLGSAIAPPLLLGLAALGGMSTSLVVAGLFAWAIAAIVFVVPITQAADSGRARPATAGTSATAGIFTPAVLGLTLFFTLLALAHGAFYSFSIVALIAIHDVSLAGATAALTAYLAGSAAGVLMGGVVADRTQRHGDLAALGYGVSAVITLAVAFLTLSAAALVVALGITGVLVGIVQPARDMLVRKAAPPGAAGRVFGIVSTGFNIGGTLGPLLFGWLMDNGAPRWVFGAAVVFMAVTALLAMLEDRRPRQRPQAA
jgi:MFS family permease